MDASGCGRIPIEDVRLALGFVNVDVTERELTALRTLASSGRANEVSLHVLMKELQAS